MAWLVIILISFILIIYLVVKTSSTNQKEEFTILKPIRGPMVSYDDYATFNYIHHTNDLPYYDPTYDNMVNAINYEPIKSKAKKPRLGKENFNKDSFIVIRGNKVRRELVPSNYADDNHYRFGINDNIPMAPQGYNIYLPE
jgi:hypothetical protein